MVRRLSFVLLLLCLGCHKQDDEIVKEYDGWVIDSLEEITWTPIDLRRATQESLAMCEERGHVLDITGYEGYRSVYDFPDSTVYYSIHMTHLSCLRCYKADSLYCDTLSSTTIWRR